MPNSTNHHVAIVGIGCLFPGASDLQTYWRNIVTATNSITDVPEDHCWSPEDHFDANPSTPDKTWCTKGGFLDKIPFDPMAFGIPPNMLESIDTTQLLSLIVAREALRDAGLDPDSTSWSRERVACIIGITGTQEMAINLGSRLQGPTWRKSLLRCGVDPELADVIVKDIANHFPTWTEQSFPGLLGNVVAGRVANRLDLGGTNCVVDAACASSLAAMQYAIGDLLAGRSDVVLTGGADTLNDTFMYQCFTRTPAFTKKGDATPFDAEADGILIGEGIAMVALKRLADAKRDGDRIYAVIKGLGSSSDGRYKSIYAPNSSGQAKALRRTYEEAQVSPRSIELIEAHGTGTKAGDLAEFAGLREVYSSDSDELQWAAMGTIKSMIGHTKSAAGAAGLVKAALALHQRVLPPTAKVTNPHEKLNINNSPFYLNHLSRPWIRAKDHPRRAAVSAFGFGGSNYHALLEEHVNTPTTIMGGALIELFAFSASSHTELKKVLSGFAAEEHNTLTHASQASLQAFTPNKTVVSFVASTLEELNSQLQLAVTRIDGRPAGPKDNLWLGQPSKEPTVAVVFPGQGSQYVNMGASLAIRHPVVRQTLDNADEVFRANGWPALSRKIFPPSPYSKEGESRQEDELRATEWAQPAIGALSAGMFSLLADFNVQPSMVAGHSYGELVALYAAGSLSFEELITASRARGEAMSATEVDRGTMLAVRGDLSAIEAALSGTQGVVIANRNHPKQAVISGSRSDLNAAKNLLTAAGFTTTDLDVAAAFHSPLVADAKAPFAEHLASLHFSAPSMPVFSCVTAEPYGEAMAEPLVEQITSPVDWVNTAKSLKQAGADLIIEVGPKGILGGLCAKTLSDIPVLSLDRLALKDDGDSQLKRALAQLVCFGCPVSFAPLLAVQPAPGPRKTTRTSVLMGGPNIRFPASLDPKMPKLPKKSAPLPPAPSTAPASLAGGWGDVPSSGAPMQKPPALVRSTSAPAQAPPQVAAPTVTAALSADLQALLATTKQTLSAFQEVQAATAAAHERFLTVAATSNEQFARLFETQARLIEQATTNVVRQPQAFEAHAPAPAVVAPIPTVLSADLLSPASVAPTVSAGFDGGRVVITTATTSVASDLPPIFDAQAAIDGKAQAPKAARSQTGISTAQLQTATLAAVAEKTGYPQDMLELSMDLEADLGIDSIKRVEILSAVQDQFPSMAEADNETMSALRTLAEVVAYLGELAGSTTAQAGATSDELQASLLQAVADKTGYPLDLLEMTMDLESDLGIDSIKRVEILSAVSEQVPSLPELDNDRMARLRTLEEVAEYLIESAGASKLVFAGPSPETLVSALLNAVAEKTGYPLDLLELSMDLESDLGIDSIKRVEILSAVQDAVPALPEIDNDALSALRTLQQVSDLLIESVGTPTSLPAIFTPKQPPTPEELKSALLSSVSEKTGYPLDLLDLSMDLESDLGIDSIKRVEIFSAVSEAVEGLGDLDNDRLSALRTLSEVLEHLQQTAAGLSFATIGSGINVGSPAILVPPAAPITRSVASSILPPVQSGSDLLTTPKVLRQRQVHLVPAPVGSAVSPGGHWVIVGERASQLVTELGKLGQTASPWKVGEPLPAGVSGLVYLGGSEPVINAFLCLSALPVPEFVATVTTIDGHFGRDHSDATSGALAGLTKTMAKEQPSCRCLAIDRHPNTPLSVVATTLLTDFSVVEIGLVNDEICTLTASDGPMPRATQIPLHKKDVVLVSGGARGVTAECIIALAKQKPLTFVLLGRSEVPSEPAKWAAGVPEGELKSACIADLRSKGVKPTPKEVSAQVAQVLKAATVRSTLARLQATGSVARYFAVDARDSSAISSAIANTVKEFGPVRALIHGAGVLADKLIWDKTTDEFERVFSTKVDGMRSLLSAVEPSELKVAVAFTSVAGRFGNPGQVDYAMANEALVQMLLHLQQKHPAVQVHAMSWGPWDGGMVDASLRAHFESQGHRVIPMALGTQAFVDILNRPGLPVETVIEGPRGPSGEQPILCRSNAPWLADHSIEGVAVLPAAMVLEWVAEVCTAVYPELPMLTISNLAVLQGVRLQNGDVNLTLSWKPCADGDGCGLAFELTGATGPLGLPTVHYRCQATLRKTQQVNKHPGSNGLSKKPYPHGLDHAYRNFLFHGERMRGIEKIVGMSDEGIVAQIRTSTPSDLGVPEIQWATDPLAVDAALQLMLLWVREAHGTAALPSSLGTFYKHAPFTKDVVCHLTASNHNAQSGSFDLVWVDKGDNIIAELQGGTYATKSSLKEAFSTSGTVS